jgi:hypothetical protein
VKIQPQPQEKRHPPHNGYKGHKTIRFPIDEHQYSDFLHDRQRARAYLDDLLLEHSEIFPAQMSHGYSFNGFTEVSAKLGLRQRRVRLCKTGHVFTLAPSFVLPYMSGRTEEVEKVLFLLRFHVPYWALAYVFGRTAMYWYGLQCSLGRLSVVGTTVARADALPGDVVADEKHTRLAGQKAYVAMTAGADCILGASLTTEATTEALERAYGVFATEAKLLKDDYTPETVNTDGWKATQQAWRRLFPQVTVILCFLHAFIKIRDRATKQMKQAFATVSDHVWQAYRSETKRQFAQRLRRLREWAEMALEPSPMRDHVLDLCGKRARFIRSYDHFKAHRTSVMVDRLMKFMNRAFFMAQSFHGTQESAELRVRSLALLWNFCPSSPATVVKHKGRRSPAERLNGKRYAANWLENLLISGSMNGYRSHQQNPL